MIPAFNNYYELRQSPFTCKPDELFHVVTIRQRELLTTPLLNVIVSSRHLGHTQYSKLINTASQKITIRGNPYLTAIFWYQITTVSPTTTFCYIQVGKEKLTVRMRCPMTSVTYLLTHSLTHLVTHSLCINLINISPVHNFPKRLHKHLYKKISFFVASLFLFRGKKWQLLFMIDIPIGGVFP